MRSLPASIVVVVAAAALASCAAPTTGKHDTNADAGPDAHGPPLGEPFDAPSGQWSFIDFPDSSCDDGSATGIGVNRGSDNDVVVFFSGGGACWDFETCFQLNTATHGPFQKAQFDALVAGGLPNTIFDRTDTANPFRTWTFVFVPYCTGDIHGGDVVTTYTSGATSKTFAHVGHKNLLAYLPRIAATFTAPDKLVVTGSSAGGGGAVLNYADFKRYYPSAHAYLLDDSLPFFEKGVVAEALVTQEATSWDLKPLVEAICGGPQCDDDMSKVHATLASTYASDRMALLSSQQDQTISEFDGLSGTQFQTALHALVDDVLTPSQWRTFTHNGASHTMLADLSNHTTADGVNVKTFVAQMIDDAANWANTGP